MNRISLNSFESTECLVGWYNILGLRRKSVMLELTVLLQNVYFHASSGSLLTGKVTFLA